MRIDVGDGDDYGAPTWQVAKLELPVDVSVGGCL